MKTVRVVYVLYDARGSDDGTVLITCESRDEAVREMRDPLYRDARAYQYTVGGGIGRGEWEVTAELRQEGATKP
jgi:hypothetical protein